MALPGAVDNLGLRPVSAFGVLLMPFTLVILPADLGGITANLLFSCNDTGCLKRFGVCAGRVGGNERAPRYASG